jgi:hypothetical protein
MVDQPTPMKFVGFHARHRAAVAWAISTSAFGPRSGVFRTGDSGLAYCVSAISPPAPRSPIDRQRRQGRGTPGAMHSRVDRAIRSAFEAGPCLAAGTS